jgi:hypothetical protein
MSTKRSAEYGEMREFTAKAKAALDAFYLQHFDGWKRLDDKERFKRNDMIAGYIKVGDAEVAIQEKFAHKKSDDTNQALYFELYHTDSHGKKVEGVGLRSAANIIIYAVWDDSHECLSRVEVLKVKFLKKRGIDEYIKMCTGKPHSIISAAGSSLRSGKKYSVLSLEISHIPEEAYVLLRGERVTL